MNLFKEHLIYEQSTARGLRKLQENRTRGWSRQPLKIEQLHEGRGLAGVVTLIPDENGSEDGPMIMWRGVTRPCTAYPDASLGPRARPTDALGVPRTVLPLCPVLACYTLRG